MCAGQVQMLVKRVHLFSRISIEEFKNYSSIGRSCIIMTRL